MNPRSCSKDNVGINFEIISTFIGSGSFSYA
jgi:hypothetical protein